MIIEIKNYRQENCLQCSQKGTKINSSKTSGILEGEYKLEVPTSNKSFFENSQKLQDLARKYDVTIKYLDE